MMMMTMAHNTHHWNAGAKPKQLPLLKRSSYVHRNTRTNWYVLYLLILVYLYVNVCVCVVHNYFVIEIFTNEIFHKWNGRGCIVHKYGKIRQSHRKLAVHAGATFFTGRHTTEIFDERRDMMTSHFRKLTSFISVCYMLHLTVCASNGICCHQCLVCVYYYSICIIALQHQQFRNNKCVIFDFHSNFMYIIYILFPQYIFNVTVRVFCECESARENSYSHDSDYSFEYTEIQI